MILESANQDIEDKIVQDKQTSTPPTPWGQIYFGGKMLQITDDNDSTTSTDSDDEESENNDSPIDVPTKSNDDVDDNDDPMEEDSATDTSIQQKKPLKIHIAAMPVRKKGGYQTAGIRPNTEELASSDNEENKEVDTSSAALPRNQKWKEARRIGRELATRKSTIHKKRLSQDPAPDKYHYLTKKNWDDQVINIPENEFVANDYRHIDSCQLTDLADWNHDLMDQETEQFGSTQRDFDKTEKVIAYLLDQPSARTYKS